MRFLAVFVAACCVCSAFAANSWDNPLAAQSHDVQVALGDIHNVVNRAIELSGRASVGVQSFSGPQLQGGVSAACGTALAGLTSVAACLTTFGSLMAAAQSGSASCVTNIDNYCSDTANSCKTVLTSAISTITSACTTDDLDQIQTGDFNFRKLLNVLSIPCSTDNAGNRCACSFFKLSQAPKVLTTAYLDTVCVACVRIFLARLAAASDDVNTLKTGLGLEFLCMTDAGKYCQIYIQDYNALPGSTSNADRYGFICANRCIEKYLVAAQLLRQVGAGNVQLDSSYLTNVRAICARNLAGELCVTKVLSYVTSPSRDFTPCSANFPGGMVQNVLPTTICPAACISIVQTFFADMGCCGASWIGMQDIGHNDTVISSNMRSWISNKCGATIPATCEAVRKVLAKLVLANLLFSYYQANKAAVDAKLCADLSATLKLPPQACSVTSGTATTGDSVNAATSGVAFQVQFTTSNSDAVTSVQNQLQTQATDGTLALPSISSLPVASRAAPAQAVSVDPSSVSVTTTNAAPRTLVSVLAVLAAALVAAFAHAQ